MSARHAREYVDKSIDNVEALDVIWENSEVLEMLEDIRMELAKPSLPEAGKVLIVLTMDLPSPESIAAALAAIDPPNLPHFTGVARIVAEPEASRVENWLDE